MKLTKVDNNKFIATFKQDINNKSVETQSDKYLYDRKKTIGFRKDKKMFKFVGIRDGYSKQLEFTIKSVVIDGTEKIAANRVNFSNIVLSGETVVHDISGLEFHNNIDLSSYRNLVKIDQIFTNLEIAYEVHIKGIKIEQSKYRMGSKMVYKQNHLGQYLVIDEGNGKVLFKIDNPIAFDYNGNAYNIINHELYEEGGKLYYKKTILENKEQQLLYIDANILFNTSLYSNIQTYSYSGDPDTSWDETRLGNGVRTVNTDTSTTNHFQGYINNLVTAWFHNAQWTYIYPPSGAPVPYIDTAVSHSTACQSWTNTFMVTGYSVASIQLTFVQLNYNPPISPPDFWIVEYPSTTTTYFPITGVTLTGQYTYQWDHTYDFTTTSAQLFIKSTTTLEEVFGLSVVVGKPGIITPVYYDSYIERQMLYFDTSSLYKISLQKFSLDFTVSSGSGGDYVIQKAVTPSDTSTDILDFNAYSQPVYAEFPGSPATYSIDLGQDIVDDFIEGSVTKLMIREKNYDYNLATPTPVYDDTYQHNWSYELNAEISKFIVTGATTLNFELESNGFGVILSQDADYNNAYSGLTSTLVVHTSTLGTYNSGATYTYDTVLHSLYRTFLNFDTSILSIYDRYVINNVKLSLRNHNYNDDFVVYQGLQDTNSGLTGTEFMSWGDYYTSVEGITLNSVVEIDLHPDVITTTGNTLFVLRNKDYDYGGNPYPIGITSSVFGIDFSYLGSPPQTFLEVEIEPYTISGIEYIKEEFGKDVTLYASRNTTDGEIYWAVDSGITIILGSGNTYSFNTIYHEHGDYIYAGILDASGNTISNNILSIYLDLYENQYNHLPERNFNVHDVDIDSVYFKYHQCISGATYTYVRELDDVYEQNIEVSDGEGIGSYNMYNEWDIIDEFYFNVHEVEVVGNLDEIDLNVSQKRINDVYIHEGTRVLLHSTVPSENDGVYVADYNLMLHKTDELSDADKAFRYKAHVNAGEYLDYEFHTASYNLTGTTTYDWADYEYWDSQIYGFEVIDMDVYSEIYFDSNVF